MKLQYVIIILLFLLITNLFSADKRVLKIYYFERYPFHFTNSSGNADGIINNITKLHLSNAKINYKFYSVPVKRIFNLLESGSYACSPGWFFTKQRAKKFKYTLPIYKGKPLVAVFNARFNIPGTISLKKLFTTNYILGLISGFNYGKVIERFLKKYPPENLKRYTVSTNQILSMVVYNRINYTFFSKDFIDFYLKSHKELKHKIKLCSINEIKHGEIRYLICSKNVDNVVLKKINKSIKRLLNSQ